MSVLSIHLIGTPKYGLDDGKIYIGRITEQYHNRTEYYDYYCKSEDKTLALFEFKKLEKKSQERKSCHS